VNIARQYVSERMEEDGTMVIQRHFSTGQRDKKKLNNRETQNVLSMEVKRDI